MTQSSANAFLIETYLAKRDDLVRFLQSRTGDRALSEDLAQEVFIRLERLSPDTIVDNPAAYLYRMAANIALDHRRAQSRTLKREAEWVDANGRRMGLEAVDETPSPEDALDARGRLSRLLEAIGDLSPQCRRVFVLHKLEGLSHADVAHELGISRSTVEKHMTTAFKRLMTLRGKED